MPHFVEQYSHMIETASDYDMLASAIDECISKNVINNVSTDIQSAIDRLDINTSFNKFINIMVWASCVSDHTETCLNLLKYFCNKITAKYSAIVFPMNEFTISVLSICADDKSFILDLDDEAIINLLKNLNNGIIGVRDEDIKRLMDSNVIRDAIRFIMDGGTLSDLDKKFSSFYKNENHCKDEYFVNEFIRPLFSILINLINNVNQQNFLEILNYQQWDNNLAQLIEIAAKSISKDKNISSMLIYHIRNMILTFKEFNDKVESTGTKNIENPIVGWLIYTLMIGINQMHEDKLTNEQITKVFISAYSIFYKNFHCTIEAKSMIELVSNAYIDSGEYTDIFYHNQVLFNSLKLYLDRDLVFKTWTENHSEYEITSANIRDDIYKTYMCTYSNPVMNLTPDFINDEDEKIVNEAALEYIRGLSSILNKYYDNSEEDIAIESAGYSEENNCPIFMLLTLGHSPLSKIITGATGDSWSHSSLSFNIDLVPLYSFGTKKMDGNNRELGFIETTPYSNLWGKVPTKYELYVIFVNKAAYQKMKNRLLFFKKNRDKLKYDFAGLVKVFFHIKNKNQAKWFCSRFVAEIINSGKTTEDDPSLYRPQTLKQLQNSTFVIGGPNIKDYDPKKAEVALERIKENDLKMSQQSEPATEAKSVQWSMDDDDEDEKDKKNTNVEIDASQSTKGYKKSSKVQEDAQNKIYKAYAKYKNNEKKVDSQLSKMLSAAKRAFTPDKTEEIIEGKKFSPISLLKRILVTAAIFNFTKVGAFVYLVTSWTIDKKRTTKQKQEILLEINTEIKMLDEKIEDARGDGNRQAKYALMRTKEELVRASNKIKYNLAATKDDMKTAKAYINNDDRDNV